VLIFTNRRIQNIFTKKIKIMPLKPGPKKIADSTGKPDRRQRDNKSTPGNTPSLKPSKSTKKK
jgi:hypothetical protein